MATQLDDRSPWTDEARSRHALRTDLGLAGDTINDGDLNIGRLATTRHVAAGDGSTVAIRWFGRDDPTKSGPIDITFEMLDHRTNRFAGGLRRHGIEIGDGVATITGRIPELYVAALGTLKASCVYTPISSALGADPIAERLASGRVKVVVTTPLLFRRTVAKILHRLPDIELVLIVGATEDSLAGVSRPRPSAAPTIMSFGVFIAEGHDTFDAPPTPPGTPALRHFTSDRSDGLTSALHDHDDVAPDRGGAAFGFIALLVAGAVLIVEQAHCDPELW